MNVLAPVNNAILSFDTTTQSDIDDVSVVAASTVPEIDVDSATIPVAIVFVLFFVVYDRREKSARIGIL